MYPNALVNPGGIDVRQEIDVHTGVFLTSDGNGNYISEKYSNQQSTK